MKRKSFLCFFHTLFTVLFLCFTILSPICTYAADADNSATQSEADDPAAQSETDDPATQSDTDDPAAQSNADTAVTQPDPGSANAPAISAPSAVLMDAATGTVLYEVDGSTQRPPASITKIMTLLLCFEALEQNAFSLDDTVTVSDYAASMGGSQVFLEPGETQTVETMLKCISIASANDAAVAMAEFVAGSEEEFVNRMNQKAAELGMADTHFVNCCGLDTDNHYTSAYDIALMSRELITNHPQIHDYCTIWQEDITHVTAKGTKPFTLTNTNKLIRQYEYATGLKTGSTSLAKYCVSATAQKNNLHLIAVIMAAPDFKVRFSDAITLLEYGFSNYYLYEGEEDYSLPVLTVKKGISNEVSLVCDEKFQALLPITIGKENITCRLNLPETVTAPVKKGAVAGYLVFCHGDSELGKLPVTYQETVEKASLRDYFLQLLKKYV